MSIKILLLVTFSLFVKDVLSQQSCNAPNSVTDLFHSDTTLWTIAESSELGKGVYRYTSQGWSFYGNENAVKITATVSGIPYIIDELHDLYQKNGNAWTKIQQDVSDVAASFQGEQLWAMVNDQLMYFQNNQWVISPTQKLTIKDLAVINDNSVYGLETSGKLYKLAGTKWAAFGNKKGIEISSTNNSTLFLSQEIINPGIPNVKKCYNTATWFPSTLTAQKITRGNDQAIYYIDAFNRLMRKSNGSSTELTRSYLNVNDVKNIAYKSNPTLVDTLTGETSLFAAILNNDLTSVYSFLTIGADINHRNFKQESPLIVATKSGRNQIATKLAEISFWKPNLSPNFELVDKYGKNALNYAVDNRNVLLVNSFLERGANPQSKDFLSQVIYYPSNDITKKQMVDLFLQNGVKVNASALVKLIQLNHDDLFVHIANHSSSDHLNPTDYNLYLKEALITGNIETAKFCVNKGADANLLGAYALTQEDKSLMMYCLNKGANANPFIEYAIDHSDLNFAVLCIDKYNGELNKALLKSCHVDNVNYATTFLKKGADADYAMMDMLKSKKLLYVKLLLEYKADGKKPAYIQKASEIKSVELVQLLLGYGAIADDGILTSVKVQSFEIVQILLPLSNSNNPALITTASSRDNLEILKLLLQSGANAQHGLFEAVKHQKLENTSLLFEHGAKVNNDTFIIEAVKNNDLKMVQLLEKNEADVTAGLALAVSKNAAPIVHFLLSRGADAYSDNKYVATAVNHNFLQTLKVLIEFEVPLDFKDENKNTLLHITCRKAYVQMTKMILDTKKVDVNAYNNSGETALMYVVTSRNKDLNFCALLVENGADVNAKNQHGERIRKMARGVKVKKYLKSKGAKKK